MGLACLWCDWPEAIHVLSPDVARERLVGVVMGNENEPRRGSMCDYRKKRGDVSRVMWPAWNGRLSVIYLGAELPPRSSSLPPGNGRAVLKCRYT